MMDLWGYRIAATLQQLKELQQYSKQPDIDLNATCPILDGSNIAGVTINIAASLIEELDLESSKIQINTLRRISLFGGKMSQFFQEIEQLSRRFEEDLRKRKFLFVSPDLHQLWGKKDAFGLGNKFKDAQEDIEEAGNCLAVAQGTACVFHLMRAMESAVQTLSGELNMTVTHKTPWRVLTTGMDGKIKKLPDSTEPEKQKKNAWEEACVNLHHVGSVWRNDTMHPAKSYTPSQALEIFNAVKVFMLSLAKL